MVMTRTRKTELTDAEIAAVKLSNRQQHGEYVTYDALSRDGVTPYVVTLRAGKTCGCTCPATVIDCRHAQAAEFQEAWDAPVAKTEQVWHDDDTDAHVADSIRSGEFEYEVGQFEQQAWAIIDAEKQAKKPVSLVERKARKDRYAVTDMKPFSLLA